MTRARIVALSLIGLAFLSLGYLRVATADDPVSVPKGALGGDLLLDPCTYSTEDGNYAADCGTLVVPGEPVRSAVAADRSTGHSHPGSLRAPGKPSLPPRGWPR